MCHTGRPSISGAPSEQSIAILCIGSLFTRVVRRVSNLKWFENWCRSSLRPFLDFKYFMDFIIKVLYIGVV